jgi:hypothetical protein
MDSSPPPGQVGLEDDTFRELARAHPSIAPLHELRSALPELRLNESTVGRDGRNRCLLSAFRSDGRWQLNVNTSCPFNISRPFRVELMGRESLKTVEPLAVLASMMLIANVSAIAHAGEALAE